MIIAKYQAWKDGILMHQYKPFNREKSLKKGEYSAVRRYDHCMSVFNGMDEDSRKEGVIFGGVEFDFLLEEVKDGEKKD